MIDPLAPVLELIAAAELGPDPLQERYREQIVQFCELNPSALHRSCLAGHLTGSAAVVDPARRAALILHHVKLDRWLQPGGHADGDNDLARVALREAQEETGIVGLRAEPFVIDLDVHRIPARPEEPEHLHLDLRFLIKAPPNCRAEKNHESHELAWWNSASRGPQPDASTQRLLIKALAVGV